MIRDISTTEGFHGKLNVEVLRMILKRYPQLTGSPTFVTVFNWMASGGKTVFLQDADSLIMKTQDLVEILAYLKQEFPAIERVTSYARSKTALKKSLKSLVDLRKAGLTRLHVGLETGDDALLEKTRKGVTSQEHVRAGQRMLDSGIELSLYVMPGLGGLDASIDHATNTARVLNEINPAYIRSRPFVPRQGTPMLDEYRNGTLRLLSPHGVLREIGMLISGLTVQSRVCFDHMMNPSYRSGLSTFPLLNQSYEGYPLPDKKGEILSIVAQGLAMDEGRFLRAEDLIGAGL
jgi:hypothetical protein